MMNKPFAKEAIDILRRYCNLHYGGNARAFSAFLEIDPDSGVVSRWLRGTGAGPTLGKIGPVMDKLNVTLLEPTTVQPFAQPAGSTSLQKENAELKSALEEAKTRINQLIGERNAFRDMAFMLSQNKSGNENNVHITNNNKS